MTTRYEITTGFGGDVSMEFSGATLFDPVFVATTPGVGVWVDMFDPTVPTRISVSGQADVQDLRYILTGRDTGSSGTDCGTDSGTDSGTAAGVEEVIGVLAGADRRFGSVTDGEVDLDAVMLRPEWVRRAIAEGVKAWRLSPVDGRLVDLEIARDLDALAQGCQGSDPQHAQVLQQAVASVAVDRAGDLNDIIDHVVESGFGDHAEVSDHAGDVRGSAGAPGQVSRRALTDIADIVLPVVEYLDVDPGTVEQFSGLVQLYRDMDLGVEALVGSAAAASAGAVDGSASSSLESLVLGGEADTSVAGAQAAEEIHLNVGVDPRMFPGRILQWQGIGQPAATAVFIPAAPTGTSAANTESVDADGSGVVRVRIAAKSVADSDGVEDAVFKVVILDGRGHVVTGGRCDTSGSAEITVDAGFRPQEATVVVLPVSVSVGKAGGSWLHIKLNRIDRLLLAVWETMRATGQGPDEDLLDEVDEALGDLIDEVYDRSDAAGSYRYRDIVVEMLDQRRKALRRAVDHSGQGLWDASLFLGETVILPEAPE